LRKRSDGQSCSSASTHAGALEERPDIGAPMAANLTGEFRPQVGQAHIIAPAIGIYDDRVSASIVAAIDQQPARAGLPHFPESDLLLALHSVPAAGRWVISQALHSRPFLIQALFDKPTLKVRKIGLKQSSIDIG
jgi:hypothetical protein